MVKSVATGGSLNTEDAWLLMTSKGFLDTVDADDPATMDAALDRLTDRYPWLADGTDTDEPDPRPTPPPSGGRARKRPDSTGPANSRNLADRFPALRARR